MKPKSNTLFHFTKSIESLQSILRTGFWPRYCLEDMNWQVATETGVPFVAVPMVCFCDIPLSRIDEHVLFYGEFGLGMTREWAVKNGLNPILYVAGNNPMTKAIAHLAHEINESSGGKKNLAMDCLQHVVMHTKPIHGQMLLGGEPVQKDFYQENEWRYVASTPGIPRFLMEDKFKDKKALAVANAKTKARSKFEFTPSDIGYIFVRSDGEIPAIVNFIQTKMDEYPSADLKILVSRVTSLETIRNDW